MWVGVHGCMKLGCPFSGFISREVQFFPQCRKGCGAAPVLIQHCEFWMILLELDSTIFMHPFQLGLFYDSCLGNIKQHFPSFRCPEPGAAEGR